VIQWISSLKSNLFTSRRGEKDNGLEVAEGSAKAGGATGGVPSTTSSPGPPGSPVDVFSQSAGSSNLGTPTMGDTHSLHTRSVSRESSEVKPISFMSMSLGYIAFIPGTFFFN
jgi:hypothetical protein